MSFCKVCGVALNFENATGSGHDANFCERCEWDKNREVASFETLTKILAEISEEWGLCYDPLKRKYCIGWNKHQYEGNSLQEVAEKALSLWSKNLFEYISKK